jgi:dihydroorotase-like cyclic amidohydrolase
MTQPPEAASRAAAFGGVTTVIDFAGALDPMPGSDPAARSILQEV